MKSLLMLLRCIAECGRVYAEEESAKAGGSPVVPVDHLPFRVIGGMRNRVRHFHMSSPIPVEDFLAFRAGVDQLRCHDERGARYLFVQQ